MSTQSNPNSSELRIDKKPGFYFLFFVATLCFMAQALNAQTANPQRGSSAQPASASMAYKDTSLPLEQRVNDLVSQMTLEEKVSQLGNNSPAIPRLGVPAYNWWNEGLHGVARAGNATVFPQAIAMAATFDTPLMHSVADVISTEFRAKYYEYLHPDGSADWYKGLTAWSPNINIFRDPRWGRGQETYGEDPYLTSRMSVAFVTGLQGDDPKYIKVVATPKHFAVHSGPESTRHTVDVKASRHDMEDTYLPAFRATVIEGKAESVMCAYNSLNGQPACANSTLLHEHLRKDWGFQGYVVSDCGAATDVFGPQYHHYTATPAEGIAAAFSTGMDVICGDYRNHMTAEPEATIAAVRQGLLPESDIDRALRRLFTARFKLGMFDSKADNPYSKITPADNDTGAHRLLALQMAREAMVLLKNKDGFLPVKAAPKNIAVIGPDADDLDALVGNYNGTPSQPVTVLTGIRKRYPDAKVTYVRGTELVASAANNGADQAVEAARNADLVVVVEGLSPRIEGEEMKVDAEGFSGGDRTSLNMPAPQEQLLENVFAVGKPTVLVLMNGSAMSINWADEHLPAIIEAWYPGEEGGTAVAGLLAGDFSPSGRLPVTFYKSVDQLPAFDDYSMSKRTYRYFEGEPLYPFGYGLSFTNFTYSDPSAVVAPNGDATVSVNVTNNGVMTGDEVVQLYLTHPGVPGAAIRALKGFQRIHLDQGKKQQVTFILHDRDLSTVDPNGKRQIVPGKVEVWIGGGQPVERSGLPKTAGVQTEFTILNSATLPD
jgi:beta-glucosidase